MRAVAAKMKALPKDDNNPLAGGATENWPFSRRLMSAGVNTLTRVLMRLPYPDDGSRLLFVVEQRGRIWSFPDEPGTSDKQEFLDIRPKVFSPASGGHNEEGLLGLAFHPAYRRNGEFFV